MSQETSMAETGALNLNLLMILILIATCVAAVVKWIRLPYSIALVLVGLVIGIFDLLPGVVLTPELILMIFLPAMLFEAAWNLNLRTLLDSIKPVAAYASIGVLISTVVVGLIVSQFLGINLLVALLFGAMVSATDPISVLALFKSINTDKRLTTILEGESLLNDGTAVVLFRILLAAIVAGGALNWVHAGFEFLLVTAGGTILGALTGFAASRITRYFDDHLLEITLTVIVAYGSYLLAEQLHVSAVIAVLVAGCVLGNYGSKTSMSYSTRLAVDSFWEYAAFIAESLVFLLIGLQIKLPLLVKYGPSIGIAILAIFLGRIAVIYGLSPFVASRGKPIPYKWRHLLFWGGLRGSLCMAMALSLPHDFPHREQLVVTVFGVALFTLIVQGLTMEPLVKLLRVKATGSSLKEKELALKESIAKQDEELQKLKKSYQTKKISKQDFSATQLILTEEKEHLKELILQLQSDSSVLSTERKQVQFALINAQKDCLKQLAKKGSVSQSTLAEFRLSLELSPAEEDTAQSDNAADQSKSLDERLRKAASSEK